jgi:hypothetical protein
MLGIKDIHYFTSSKSICDDNVNEYFINKEIKQITYDHYRRIQLVSKRNYANMPYLKLHATIDHNSIKSIKQEKIDGYFRYLCKANIVMSDNNAHNITIHKIKYYTEIVDNGSRQLNIGRHKIPQYNFTFVSELNSSNDFLNWLVILSR